MDCKQPLPSAEQHHEEVFSAQLSDICNSTTASLSLSPWPLSDVEKNSLSFSKMAEQVKIYPWDKAQCGSYYVTAS